MYKKHEKRVCWNSIVFFIYSCVLICISTLYLIECTKYYAFPISAR